MTAHIYSCIQWIVPLLPFFLLPDDLKKQFEWMVAVKWDRDSSDGLKMAAYEATVPAFNSSTKCVGSSGILHDRTPDCNPISKAWIQAHVPDLTTCFLLACYVGRWCAWLVIHACFYHQTLTDVRSTGSGIQQLNVWTVAWPKCKYISRRGGLIYTCSFQLTTQWYLRRRNVLMYCVG